MERSVEVEQALRRFYGILSAGDAEGLAGAVSTRLAEVVGIGIGGSVEPGQEWLAGFQQELREQPGVRRDPGEQPACFAEGPVGWFADRPTLTFADGATVRPRLTGVMRHEDGRWRLVSLHASLPQTLEAS